MAVRVPPSAAPVDDRRPSPYERLKQAILTGELVPGQQLVETPLAQWCQVSRTPIREALTRLEQDGLVLRTDRGLVVRERSPEEILDIYETRIVLEAMAARTAAIRRSPIDVITMRRVADRLERLDTGDEIELVEANRDLHRALWRATHNESLIDLLTRLDLHLARYPATTLSQPGRWREANAEHRAIVDAVDAQDPDLAEDLAAKHFTRARDLRLAIWAAGSHG
ncbi:GntR family transcriptional regulator [Streptosporangium lutulentum]|uniref:DNA-binding GntR family transcriptional regulator n=1 Tax=Streptosporangium lutulentum TaxID=1461250 RepID=A0ABT9QIF0_9ACTN|nr:GntR family transcriptional regulator [Streptosporangium lutulentum]MDP9846525.1 DNA-binding GntR family transcriptional regulator [Streptosporangium lutulentum]